MSALAQERDWLLSAVGGSVREFYSAIGVPLPNRAGDEASVSCFANPAAHKRDDRTPSCSVNLLTGLWSCKGCGEAGNAYGAGIALGFSEPRARDLARSHGLFLETAPKAAARETGEKVRLPTEPQLRKMRSALHDSPTLMGQLRESKGWTRQAIVRCGLGWDGERVTFAVRDPKLKVVGVVRYLPGGKPKSLALPGSKRGLFPAPEVMTRRRPLFVVEGEPDAVSVRSCGHQAVAVPGAGGWRPEFAARLAGRRLVVLADCDPQGRELAYRVASVLPNVRVVDLEPDRDDGCDIGDWVKDAVGDGGLAQVSRLLDGLAA